LNNIKLIILAVLAYAFAMVVANLLVAIFGPWITPINAFFLIGLSLTLRDVLHVQLKKWQMGVLIGCTGIITWLCNPAAGMIAIASSLSFTISSVIDWLIFVVAKGTWFRRSNLSNIAGSITDSIIFPTLAFGVLMPLVVLSQFVAKVAGGVAWSFMLRKRFEKIISEVE